MQACTRQVIFPTLALRLKSLRQAILMPRSAKAAHSTNHRMKSALHGGFTWIYKGAASRAARAGLPPTTGAGSSTGNAPVSIAQLPCRQPPGGLTLAQRCAALRTVRSVYGAHYKVLISDVSMRLLLCGWLERRLIAVRQPFGRRAGPLQLPTWKWLAGHATARASQLRNLEVCCHPMSE